MTQPANLTTEWARVLLASLALAGVRSVVASPGSRSTPFVWAALQTPGLSLTTVVDERSAAFYALGQAKLSGVPSALLCTSGSAVANYFPAIVEASESATPLVVVSADRPLELQGVGAPQTIDQTRMFGEFARQFVDLGSPDDAPGCLEALARRVAQAVLRSRGPLAGPVHVNARARKPLEPRAAESDPERELARRADAAVASVPRVHAARASVDLAAVRALSEACARALRGIVVCGPLPAFEPRVRAAALARALGFVLLPEATSQARFALDATGAVLCDASDAVLEALADHDPDVILQLGAAPVSSAWQRYLGRHPRAELHVLSPHGWPDPDARATSLTLGPVAASVEALIERARASAPSAWQQRFAEENARAWRAVEAHLGDGFSEGCAVRAAVDALPAGAVLVLGNSLPVREVDRFCPARPADLTVVATRGSAGIDGLISTAAGAASAAARPTLLLVGDVSFLHDVGGLWAARELLTPLAIVVLNNGGGRIFDELPIARELAADARFRHWRTPHDFDFAHAAALYRLPYQAAASRPELAAAIEHALAHAGCTLIEARVGGSA